MIEATVLLGTTSRERPTSFFVRWIGEEHGNEAVPVGDENVFWLVVVLGSETGVGIWIGSDLSLVRNARGFYISQTHGNSVGAFAVVRNDAAGPVLRHARWSPAALEIASRELDRNLRRPTAMIKFNVGHPAGGRAFLGMHRYKLFL